MTYVGESVSLEACLLPLRVLALDGFDLLAPDYADPADVHLLDMKLEVDLYLAVGVLFPEPVEDLLDLLLALEPENVGDLSAGPPFLEVELDEDLALADVVVFTEVASALDTLLLVLLGGALDLLIHWLQVDGLLEVSCQVHLGEVWDRRRYVFWLNHRLCLLQLWLWDLDRQVCGDWQMGGLGDRHWLDLRNLCWELSSYRRWRWLKSTQTNLELGGTRLLDRGNWGYFLFDRNWLLLLWHNLWDGNLGDRWLLLFLDFSLRRLHRNIEAS